MSLFDFATPEDDDAIRRAQQAEADRRSAPAFGGVPMPAAEPWADFTPSLSPSGVYADRFSDFTPTPSPRLSPINTTFYPPEDQPSPSYVAPGFERTATGIQQLSPERLNELNPPLNPSRFGGLFESILPEESNPLRHIPIIGDEAARVTSGMLNPMGFAAMGPALVGPGPLGMFAAGTAGSIGLGAVGQGLESLGVPGVPTPIGDIGPRTIGEVVGGLWGGPGREFLKNMRIVPAEEALNPEALLLARGTMPSGATSGLDESPPRTSPLVGVDTPEPPPASPGAPDVGGGHGLGDTYDPNLALVPAPEMGVPVVEGERAGNPARAGRPLRNGLDNLVQDAEQAAHRGDDLPFPGRTTADSASPEPNGRTIPFPRPSTLHTVEEIAADARRSTQNFIGATTRVAGKIPPIRSVLETVNPSAFWNDPPEAIVKELGSTSRAQDLMANLGAYNRKIEQANAQLSATGDAIRQQARKVGLKVKDARIVNIEGQPFVGDFFENPSRYNMTPAQRQFADDVDGLLKDMAATEKVAGVKRGEIFSDEGRYFPRAVQSSGDISSIRGPVRQNVGAKQGFQKNRFYESMAEGNENGVNYKGDISALVTTRLRAGLKAVTDKEVEGLLKPLGRIPTDELPAKFGEMGTTLSGLGSRVFLQNTAVQMMESLTAKGAPGGLLSPARIINSVMVPLRATGDLSLTLLQALPTAFRNPVAFFKAVGYELDGLLLDGRNYGNYVEKNARWVERFTAAGGEMRGSDVTWGGNVSGQWMRRSYNPLKPLTGRFDNAFTNGANVAALENFKGMVGVGESAGNEFLRKAGQIAFGNISGQTTDEVAASIASKMTGRMSTRALGVSQAQQQAEGILMFAPKFYRATFGLLGDAVQGGMRGAEARRVLGSLIAGAGATYAGVSAALGQTPIWDPRRADFLTVSIDGQRVGFGGPLHGMLRAVAKAVDDPSRLDKVNPQNPLVAWARGRTSPVVGILTDMITGRDFLGTPIDRSPEGMAKYASENALPFAAQAAVEEGGTSALATGLGLRSFPVSPRDQLTSRFRDVTGHDYNPESPGDRDIIIKNAELSKLRVAAQAHSLELNPERADLKAKEIQAEKDSGLAKAAQGVLNGDPDAAKNYAKIRGDFLATRAGIRLGAQGDKFEAQTDIGRLVDRYYAVSPEQFMDDNGTVDWKAHDAAQAEIAAQMPEADRNALLTKGVQFNDPLIQQAEGKYQKAVAVLRQLDETPKYRGMTIEQQQALVKIEADVPQKQRELSLAAGHVVPLELAAKKLMVNDMNQPALFKLYVRMNDPDWMARMRNPAYDQLLLQARDDLSLFFPKFYSLNLDVRAGLLRGRGYNAANKPPLAGVDTLINSIDWGAPPPPRRSMSQMYANSTTGS